MRLLISTLFIICFIFKLANAEENSEKLLKIEKDLKTIKSLYESNVLEKEEYESSKNKLLKRKAALQPKKETSDKKTRSTDLDKQLDVIKKLYDDGILAEDDYNKTKSLLIKKDKEKKQADAEWLLNQELHC